MSSDDSVPVEVVEKMRVRYRKEAMAAVQEGYTLELMKMNADDN